MHSGHQPPAKPTGTPPRPNQVITAAREPVGEESVSVLNVFPRRVATLALTDDRRLRLVTGLALAQLIACALLLLIRDWPMPSISIASSDGELIEIGIPIFSLVIVFSAVAWTYLLAGAIRAHIAIRVIGLVLFTGAFALLGWLPLSNALAAGLPAALLVPIAAGILIGTWWIALISWHPARANPGQLSIARFALLLALILALYLDCWLAARSIGNSIGFGLGITNQLFFIQFLLVPVLILTGADLAEWSQATAEALFHATHKLRLRVVAVLACISIAAIVAYAVSQLGPETLTQVALGTMALVAIAAIGFGARVHRWTDEFHVPTRALVTVAILFYVFLSIATIVPLLAALQARPAPGPVGLTFVTFSHSSQPVFAITRPSLWETKLLLETPDTYAVAFTGGTSGNPASAFVFAFEGTKSNVLTTLYPQNMVVGYERLSDSWIERQFTLSPPNAEPMGGLAWQRFDHGWTWLVFGLTRPNVIESYRPVFDKMRQDWRNQAHGAQSQPESASGNQTVGVAALFWIPVVLLGIASLYVTRNRTGVPRITALFVTVAAAILVLKALGFLTALLPAAIGRLTVPSLRLAGVQVVVAIVSVGYIGFLFARHHLDARKRRLIGSLVALNLGLFIVTLLSSLYGLALDAEGRFSVAQALVILFALGWEFVMSGGSLSGQDGTWFPRHARLLLFFGYILLVASEILYFSSLRIQATGTRTPAWFESDRWPQGGLVVVGVPLLLTVFLLRLGSWLRWAKVATSPHSYSKSGRGPGI